ncbi:Signal transduction histidine kinase [Rhodoferax sp. OV413]|uniref:sensor histidine kinase n=1 Tax=Rhodoferax sp. OV413 TaxID=1855285 RepID=UPI000890338A|nr:sensor histidine kinase [Rhodoferax sp. OV413]SDP91520.1 Signal transduction histidine kinase [Rhodoferax sp. OV413]
MQGILRKRWATVPRLWAVGLGLGLSLVVTAVVALWHLRGETIDSQARELSLLSLALTDEIHRELRGMNAGLHAMQVELEEGSLPTTGTAAERALRTRTELMSMVDSLSLVDRSGRLLAASVPTAMPDLASFAPGLNQLDEDAVAVSRPFADPRSHAMLVTMAVPFTRPLDSSGGWIFATMPAEALLGAFSVASPAADARMAVFRRDGVLLVGGVVNKARWDEATIAKRLATQRSTELRQLPDGTERLVALHSLERYGLEVVLTRDLDVMLVSWREAAQLTAVGLVLLLAVLAASVHLVHGANQRRATAQAALQTQLSRANKLESLGELAGGVAHDFNNVLAAIVGFGEMAQDAAAPGSAQARHLDKVLQAALRGKALVERILSFGRGGGCASTVFELEPIVAEVLTLLAATLRPGIVLERGLEAHGALLRGDPTQAFEAVMNLCTNAMQAMPQGGMVGVQLVREQVPALRVLSHTQLLPGPYLVLSVTDRGTGITPEVMERLFEPFFTTRSAHAGTGLGLAVVHGVVAEFGGAIDVQSKPGQGARFTLYFPECTDALDAAKAGAALASAGGGQTLLVVDDEPTLVALAEEMFTGMGYQPVGYTDPVAALQALRDEPHRFAAVVTDEVMPGMTGIQLTEAIRKLSPTLPILMVSGYGGASLAQRAASAGVSKLLTKPMQRADLARALALLLPS